MRTYRWSDEKGEEKMICLPLKSFFQSKTVKLRLDAELLEGANAASGVNYKDIAPLAWVRPQIAKVLV